MLFFVDTRCAHSINNNRIRHASSKNYPQPFLLIFTFTNYSNCLYQKSITQFVEFQQFDFVFFLSQWQFGIATDLNLGQSFLSVFYHHQYFLSTHFLSLLSQATYWTIFYTHLLLQFKISTTKVFKYFLGLSRPILLTMKTCFSFLRENINMTCSFSLLGLHGGLFWFIDEWERNHTFRCLTFSTVWIWRKKLRQIRESAQLFLSGMSNVNTEKEWDGFSLNISKYTHWTLLYAYWIFFTWLERPAFRLAACWGWPLGPAGLSSRSPWQGSPPGGCREAAAAGFVRAAWHCQIWKRNSCVDHCHEKLHIFEFCVFFDFFHTLK